MVVLARMTAPASRIRVTMVASRPDMNPSNSAEP